MTVQSTPPATEAQVSFLIKLLAERIEDPAKALDAIKRVNEHTMSKATASAKISQYLAMPKLRNAFSKADQLDEGMYVMDGQIFKVYTTRKGFLATKQLIEGKFEYMGRKPLHKLTAGHRMTVEEAKEYGRVTGTCCQCSRKLTDETSIAEGIGPICASRI